MSLDESKGAVAGGWAEYGIVWYQFTADFCDEPPTPVPALTLTKAQVCRQVNFLYRSYNGGRVDHFYTMNNVEWNQAESSGWGMEGIIYILKFLRCCCIDL